MLRERGERWARGTQIFAPGPGRRPYPIAEIGYQAARRSYRWCKPPTSGSLTTSLLSGDITARDVGASLMSDRCVARAMVVGEVRCEDSQQMALAEDDHVVETLGADPSNQSFDERYPYGLTRWVARPGSRM